MEGSVKELIRYRMDRANEMLVAAEENLKVNQYRTSLNRSYYAVFHAMRAVNILDGFDSSKHSGVIAYFNKAFLKEGKLDKNLSKIIKDTSYLREKSDYDDFYLASRQDAERQMDNARNLLSLSESIWTLYLRGMDSQALSNEQIVSFAADFEKRLSILISFWTVKYK